MAEHLKDLVGELRMKDHQQCVILTVTRDGGTSKGFSLLRMVAIDRVFVRSLEMAKHLKDLVVLLKMAYQ